MVAEIKTAFPAFYEFLCREAMRDAQYGVYDVLSGAMEDALQKIEADLNIELPASYKRFLRCARGMTLLGGAIDFGVEHPCYIEYNGKTMFCFAACYWAADGDLVFFDIDQGLHEEEYPVMYYGHDGGPEILRLTDSFEEWIERWLPDKFGGNESESLLRSASPPVQGGEELLRALSSSEPSSPKQLMRASETPKETRVKKQGFWRSLFKRE